MELTLDEALKKGVDAHIKPSISKTSLKYSIA